MKILILSKSLLIWIIMIMPVNALTVLNDGSKGHYVARLQQGIGASYHNFVNDFANLPRYYEQARMNLIFYQYSNSISCEYGAGMRSNQINRSFYISQPERDLIAVGTLSMILKDNSKAAWNRLEEMFRYYYVTKIRTYNYYESPEIAPNNYSDEYNEIGKNPYFHEWDMTYNSSIHCSGSKEDEEEPPDDDNNNDDNCLTGKRIRSILPGRIRIRICPS